MFRKLTIGFAAASMAFLAVPATAQEAEEPRTTYRIEYLKLKPGMEQRWIEMGEKYYGPATEAAGQKHPTIHWLMSGPWDIMMVFELPRGMAMLDSHNSPERTARSEEHTSELQSLMRISYAVFCLKKKKKQHK